MSSNWLIYPQPNPQAKLRLLCCHPAGSGASIFRSWSQYLHPEVELCALQLPGRESRLREPLLTEIEPFMDTLVQEVISSDLLARPLAVFGHSFGALVAFALARQLRAQQLPEPIHLFLSSRKPVHLPVTNFIHRCQDRQLIEELRGLGATPEPILQNSELMELFLSIFRADLTLNETYPYSEETPFNYPITVFGGRDDSSVSEEQLSQWAIHTSSDFQLKMFPGAHMFFVKQPQPLISEICKTLNLNSSPNILRSQVAVD